MRTRLIQSKILAAFVFAASFWSQPVAAQIIVTQGTNISADISPVHAEIAMDLLGGLWLLSSRGGQAEVANESLLPINRPRWSPDGQSILYQAESVGRSSIRILDFSDRSTRTVSGDEFSDQQATWHPDGTRIVYSSARHDSGLDLWETDLSTGLSWRVTSDAGDETEPAWSANGRHLAWVRHVDGEWTLMLRRFAQADVALVTSDEPLSAPSWRPDGSLISFLRKSDDRLSVRMLILSDPPLEMPFMDGEDFFQAPLSWRDRQNFVYTSDGMVKMRSFGGRRARALHFRAQVGRAGDRIRLAGADRELPVNDAAAARFIVRSQRIFDGTRYREGMDIMVDGARIVAVAPGLESDDAVELDFGNVTVLPGFIDIYSNLPEVTAASGGAQLLAYGVTTVVSDSPAPFDDETNWDGEATPGPRLLLAADMAQGDGTVIPALVTVRAGSFAAEGQRSAVSDLQLRGIPVLAENWMVGLGLGADLLLGADTLPSSPTGRRYQDMLIAIGAGPLTLVSGLADAGTPGLEDLLQSRQAKAFGHRVTGVRHSASSPVVGDRDAAIALGSKPNGLPAGLALHAELRALAAAGIPAPKVLRSMGETPAKILGFERQIGVIAPGALADLILVQGDPLNDVSDALKIVAVMRNGRFFSLASLLERAQAPGQ